MAKAVMYINESGDKWGWKFFCPGCQREHLLDHRWKFNGNYDSPTFRASVLFKSGPIVCHSFVTDGNIQFLNDCTHSLKGQTVSLPEI
jgi:hypothetical protein